MCVWCKIVIGVFHVLCCEDAALHLTNKSKNNIYCIYTIYTQKNRSLFPRNTKQIDDSHVIDNYCFIIMFEVHLGFL